MAVFLLGGLSYTIYWSSIWDQTSDGLGGIFLAQFGAMVGVGAGMLLMVFCCRLAAVGGLLFLVRGAAAAVPGLQPWLAGFLPCDHRAASGSIATALERYHARTGAYPQELSELTPRDLLFIPQPVILQGEPWCYQGAAGSYRLGAVFREYFSSPWSIKVYASAGETLASAWACETRLAELKVMYDRSFTEQPPAQSGTGRTFAVE